MAVCRFTMMDQKVSLQYPQISGRILIEESDSTHRKYMPRITWPRTVGISVVYIKRMWDVSQFGVSNGRSGRVFFIHPGTKYWELSVWFPSNEAVAFEEEEDHVGCIKAFGFLPGIIFFSMKPAFRDCLSFTSSGFQGTQDYLETLKMG